MVNFFAGGGFFLVGKTSFPLAARGLALETVFIPMDANGSSSMPPNEDGIVTVVGGGTDGFAVLAPMLEKAKALSSKSSLSLQPSSSSSPHPSSTIGAAGFGVVSDVAANCCVGGRGAARTGCCGGAGLGAAGGWGFCAGAGAGVAEGEVIQEEIPDKYPVLVLFPLAGGAGTGAVAVGAAAVLGRFVDGLGAPNVGGSPRSVIKFDSC